MTAIFYGIQCTPFAKPRALSCITQ